jgi:alkylated DNA repair dioxygenase AlkB
MIGPGTLLPDGFHYQPEVITKSEETELTAKIRQLEFRPFEFHGHVGNRRVVSFGFRYDYTQRAVFPAEELPSWLNELRTKVATFAGRNAEDFKQAGINEYSQGAGIGWHRDKSEFGDVVGVSLVSSVKLRFRRQSRDRWIRSSQLLAPRSVYLLRGEARQVWEHSIPPAAELRYSIMFRTLRTSEPPRPIQQ